MPKTIDEIAKETGFSRTTIAMVVNGRAENHRISRQTIGLIQDYIAIHGCTINYAARSLKLHRSDVIGFVAPDLANAFFARLMAALELQSRRHGLLVLAASTHEDPATEQEVIENLLARGVDGLILAPCTPPDPRALSRKRHRVPSVIVDRYFGPGTAPVVMSDHFHSALAITTRLLALAQGGIAFLCGHEDLPSIQERIRGFREATATTGRGVVLGRAEDSLEAGYALMTRLLAEAPRPPGAFLCSSLLILEGALLCLKQRLGALPPDLPIGTFDYHAMLETLPNPVLAVRQNETALAAAAFRCLKTQMDGHPPPISLEVVPGEMMLLGPGRPTGGGPGKEQEGSSFS